jgi:Dolichyl-phosphate-mannose-protein mannosyltransferase
MATASQWKYATMSLPAGLILLSCALTFYYFAVLRIDYAKTSLLDLAPSPDAPEYFAQAKALLKDEWPSIRIGYDKLPARFFPGYPAVMLVWLKNLPASDSILAPFRTNQTIGLLVLLAVFGFYTYLAMPLTGGFAALLLATLPSFFTFCRSSMSEISASALIVLAFMFAYLGLREERRWKIYVSAVFLGLSFNIRMQLVFFAPLLLAIALFSARGKRLRWFLHCAAVLSVFILAASPMLVLDTIQFHSPFRTGYQFWLKTPDIQISRIFFIYFIPGNVAMLWREFVLRPHAYSTVNIFGTGTSFVPAFILLIFAGLSFIRVSRFVVCAFLASFTFLTMTLVFQTVDARYYLPLLMLSVAVAVLPVNWAAKSLFNRKQVVAAAGIFVLFAAACLGYPSCSGFNATQTDRSQAWDALHFTTPPGRSGRFVAAQHFLEIFGSAPCIVLSDIDPVYLNALFPEHLAAAPLDGDHPYRFSQIWHYERPEALALVKAGLNKSLPIYALFTSPAEMISQQSRLPAVPGYEWRTVNDSDTNAVILKLALAQSREGASP